MGSEDNLRFAPSNVEGLPAVTEVAIFPDRMELLSNGKWVTISYLALARWHRYGWLYRPLAHLGWIFGRPLIADRDWFHPPAGRFFRFYADPPVTMPNESAETDYVQTTFYRVQNVIGSGGFSTFDLG